MTYFLQLVVLVLKEAFYYAVGTQRNDADRLSEVIPKNLYDDVTGKVHLFSDQISVLPSVGNHRRPRKYGQTYCQYVVDLEYLLFLFGMITGHRHQHVSASRRDPQEHYSSTLGIKLKVATIRELGYMISKGVSLSQVTVPGTANPDDVHAVTTLTSNHDFRQL
jgi:hypothetical protein